MRVAVSFWIAGAAYLILVAIGAIRFVASGPDTWSSHLLNPVHISGLLPPVVASIVALTLRGKRTFVQLIPAGLTFLLVAPASTFASGWVRVVLSQAMSGSADFYSYSVALGLVYLQIPQLVVALIALACICVALTLRRRPPHASA